MCLGAEIGLFVVGIYYLITGKAKINKTHEIKGMPVRLLGLICMATLPLALFFGVMLGVLIGFGALPSSVTSYAFAADALAIVIVALIGSGYYFMIKENATEITPTN